jgi:hypothetical protein
LARRLDGRGVTNLRLHDDDVAQVKSPFDGGC